MSDSTEVTENEVTTTDGTDVPAGEKGSEETTETTTELSSLEDALKEVERLKEINAQVISSRDEVKEKLRKRDAEDEEAKQKRLKEQGKYKELYEKEAEKRTALETKIRDQAVDSALVTSLTEAGALAVETALPLVSREKIVFDDAGNIVPESVVDAITEVKEKHKVLFGEKKTTQQMPNPKRPGSGDTEGGYIEELKKLQMNLRARPQDLAALKQKYGVK